MSSQEILALNVKVLRSLRGLTQEELAETADMKRTQISALERGHRGVQMETIDRLAKALGVDPWELLRPRDCTGR